MCMVTSEYQGTHVLKDPITQLSFLALRFAFDAPIISEKLILGSEDSLRQGSLQK